MYSPNEQNIAAVQNPDTPLEFILDLLAHDEKRFWKSYIPTNVANPEAQEYFLAVAVEDARIRSEKRGKHKDPTIGSLVSNPHLSAEFLMRLVNDHNQFQAMKQETFTVAMLEDIQNTSSDEKAVRTAVEELKMAKAGLRNRY